MEGENSGVISSQSWTLKGIVSSPKAMFRVHNSLRQATSSSSDGIAFFGFYKKDPKIRSFDKFTDWILGGVMMKNQVSKESMQNYFPDIQHIDPVHSIWGLYAVLKKNTKNGGEKSQLNFFGSPKDGREKSKVKKKVTGSNWEITAFLEKPKTEENSSNNYCSSIRDVFPSIVKKGDAKLAFYSIVRRSFGSFIYGGVSMKGVKIKRKTMERKFPKTHVNQIHENLSERYKFCKRKEKENELSDDVMFGMYEFNSNE